MRRFFFLLPFLLLVFFALTAKIRATVSLTFDSSSYAPGEIIVQFRPLVPQGIMERITQDSGAQIKERLFLPRTFVLKVPTGQEENLAKTFSQNLLVSYAEPNFKAYALAVPNDPYFSLQWGMTKSSRTRGLGYFPWVFCRPNCHFGYWD